MKFTNSSGMVAGVTSGLRGALPPVNRATTRVSATRACCDRWPAVLPPCWPHCDMLVHAVPGGRDRSYAPIAVTAFVKETTITSLNSSDAVSTTVDTM